MKVMLSVLLLLISLPGFTQSTPAAVITDPAPDATKAAGMEELAISSHGEMMNGLIYVAEGPKPHPTVILLHGFPGYEQNLDLAQAIRRAGWNVIFFHYRGSWGSHGNFSFSNAQEDTATAIAWARNPSNAKQFMIDSKHLVLIGHSMGGFMAAAGGAHDPKISGIVMISAWNIGGEAKYSSDVKQRRARFAAEMGPLAGCTPDSLIAEMDAHKDALDYNTFAPQLKMHRVLVISSNDGLQPANDAFVSAMNKAGAQQVTSIHIPTDHAYSDHRIALETAVLEWLKKVVMP